MSRDLPLYRVWRDGALVASTRPIPAARLAEAVTITARIPAVHGAPVHIGEPAARGITDSARSDFGDAVEIRAGEVPVFRACGVRPQAAGMVSKPPFAIPHAPGHIFTTDIRDTPWQV